MAKYPLALLPVVTIVNGQARLAPHGVGGSVETGTPAQAISSWVAQVAAWIHVLDQDSVDGREPNHHHIVSSGAHLQYSGVVNDAGSLALALATGASAGVCIVASCVSASREISSSSACSSSPSRAAMRG